MLTDVVLPGPSKSRRIKSVYVYFVTEQCSCSAKRPAKQRLSLSKQIQWGYGLTTEYQRENAVNGACTVTRTARD